MNAITSKATALQTKLAAAILNVEKLQAELDGLTKYDGIKKGDTVGITFGRGESKVNEQGEVVAISTDAKGGKVYNVLVTKDGKASLRAVTVAAINGWVPTKSFVDTVIAEGAIADVQKAAPADVVEQPAPEADSLDVGALLDAAAQ